MAIALAKQRLTRLWPSKVIFEWKESRAFFPIFVGLDQIPGKTIKYFGIVDFILVHFIEKEYLSADCSKVP